jgi:hypothetical protein
MSTASSVPPSDFESLFSNAATSLQPYTGGTYDVVNKYRWTLSNDINKLKEVPKIILKEYYIDESTIETQLSYYGTGVQQAFKGSTDPLAPYEQLFPRTPTNNIYQFPYFSDINFELNTPQWASLDNLEQAGKVVESGAGALGGDTAAAVTRGVIQGAAKITQAGLGAMYPKVGIMDRPKLWQSHDFRTVEIKFPLFNTVSPSDWEINRTLCWLLINQNLFTKRDFITGIPPVYYEVIIPGQHYSYAASVTNLTILNRGNTRLMKDRRQFNSVVPDAYEINMTLTDMVMPSRNLFRSIQTKQQEVVVTTA